MSPGRRKKVLLVDDSSTILMVEQLVLAREPYTLITARDGQEAVAKALAERPDAIVMDAMMPRLDGFDAVRELRRREETRSIPVIMITTRGELDNVAAAFESGCNDFVTKPIDPPELLAKLRSLLGE